MYFSFIFLPLGFLHSLPPLFALLCHILYSPLFPIVPLVLVFFSCPLSTFSFFLSLSRSLLLSPSLCP